MCETAGGPVVRKMLEDMGVLVIEEPRLCVKAAYVDRVGVLLVRPDLSPQEFAQAADLALLGEIPRPRRPAEP